MGRAERGFSGLSDQRLSPHYGTPQSVCQSVYACKSDGNERRMAAGRTLSTCQHPACDKRFRLFCNQGVRGSSPLAGTSNFNVLGRFGLQAKALLHIQPSDMHQTRDIYPGWSVAGGQWSTGSDRDVRLIGTRRPPRPFGPRLTPAPDWRDLAPAPQMRWGWKTRSR